LLLNKFSHFRHFAISIERVTFSRLIGQRTTANDAVAASSYYEIAIAQFTVTMVKSANSGQL